LEASLVRAIREVDKERERAARAVEELAFGGQADRNVHPLVQALATLEWTKRARQDYPREIARVCEIAIERLGAPASNRDSEIDADIIRGSHALLRAELGNAYRILRDFRPAHGAFKAALSLLDEVADPDVIANVLLLAGVYSKDVRDFDVAEHLGRRSLNAFREIGEQRGAERAQRLLAAIPFVKGDLAGAKKAFLELLSRPLLDRSTELSAIWHIFKIHALEGRTFEGNRFLPRFRELVGDWTDSVGVRSLLKWLNALILGGIGRPDEGAALLEEVRNYYLGQEITFDAALASVDLAFLYLRGGHASKAARVASEAASVLYAAQPDNPAALAAIRTFAEAMRDQKATQAIYQGTVTALEQGRTGPSSPSLSLYA